MNQINTFTPNKKSSFDGISQIKNDQTQQAHSSFIKHQLHEKKVDEFFWTDLEAPAKRTSLLAIIGAIIGVLAPVLMIGKSHNKDIKFDSFKNIYEATKFHYEVKELIQVGCGGVLGGLLGGLLDRKEKRKIDKIEEASFQLMNITFPALFVAGGIKLCEQSKFMNKSVPKLLVSALGMFLGVNLAVKGANRLDDIYFDKHNIDIDRKFKKRDLIIHIDDLAGSLVLAKIPFADKIHAEKILPLIFAWNGYHVGEK